MKGVETDIVDPQLALQRARVAVSAFASLPPRACSQEVASQLFASLNELVQVTDRLLAEKEQFRSRLHRSATFSIPENSDPTAAL
jgi:hypothetical protein